MRKNKKGFTLVEVIITVALLGIISVIAFPSIINLRTRYATREYEVYESALESAAKLYVDSYAIDVFGYNEYGCNKISIKELEKKDLITDIDMKDVSCDTHDSTINEDRSYVIVRKYSGSKEEQYSYDAYIYCEKKNSFVYESKKPVGCDGTIPDKKGVHPNRKTDTAAPIMKVFTSKEYVKTGEKISIGAVDQLTEGASGLGFNENAKLKYTWTDKDGKELENKEYSFRNKTLFFDKLEDAKIKVNVDLPTKDGKITINVKPKGKTIQDINGNIATKEDSKTFIYDNTPPEIKNIKVTGAASGNLSFDVSDNYIVDKYTVLRAEDKDNNNEWKDLNEKTHSFCGLTLPNGKYVIKAKDGAGNITVSKEFEIDMLSAPTVEFNNYKGGWANYNVLINVTYRKPAVVGYYEYSTDNGKTWLNVKSNIQNVANITNGIQVPITSEGVTYIRFRVVEKNTYVKGPETSNYEVKIDKTAPECVKGGDATSWSGAYSRKLTKSCTDKGGSGCKANSFSQTFTIGDNEAMKSGKITISDNANNTTSCGINVLLDRKPPEIWMETQPYGTPCKSRAGIYSVYRIKDTDSEIAYYGDWYGDDGSFNASNAIMRFDVNSNESSKNNNHQTMKEARKEHSWSAACRTGNAPNKNADYRVKVYAKDAVGNEAKFISNTARISCAGESGCK